MTPTKKPQSGLPTLEELTYELLDELDEKFIEVLHITLRVEAGEEVGSCDLLKVLDYYIPELEAMISYGCDPSDAAATIRLAADALCEEVGETVLALVLNDLSWPGYRLVFPEA